MARRQHQAHHQQKKKKCVDGTIQPSQPIGVKDAASAVECYCYILFVEEWKRIVNLSYGIVMKDVLFFFQCLLLLISPKAAVELQLQRRISIAFSLAQLWRVWICSLKLLMWPNNFFNQNLFKQNIKDQLKDSNVSPLTFLLSSTLSFLRPFLTQIEWQWSVIYMDNNWYPDWVCL